MVTKMKSMGVKGFSLVELMIVVAIIGILAAVAIPNFQRFQRKARQSEATAALGSIHSAQNAFHGQWEQYTSELPSAGYTPDGTLRYNSGFQATFGNGWSNGAAPADYTGQALGTTLFNTVAICGVAPYNLMCAVGAAPALAVGTAGAGTGNAATFTAGSEGTIGGAMNDQWTITNLKVLMNVTDGTL